MPRRFSMNNVYVCDLENKQCLAKNKNGSRCKRKTFRNPFCLQHCNQHLGLTIKPSVIIPGAGCGLFATRDFRVGDVLLPYTGKLESNTGPPNPYSMTLVPSTQRINSCCLRGIAAYANNPLRNVSHANVTTIQATISSDPAWLARSFGPPDTTTGLCPVISTRLRREKKWKRIHPILLRCFQNQTLPWVICTRPIASGDEIFLNYRQPSLLRMIHSTIPRSC